MINFYDASGMGIPEAKSIGISSALGGILRLIPMHRRKMGLANEGQLDYIKKVSDQD